MLMTKEKALRIQSEQIAYYSQWVPNLSELVAKVTRADELDDGEHEVYIINKYIPRGGAIENIVKKHNRTINFSDI